MAGRIRASFYRGKDASLLLGAGGGYFWVPREIPIVLFQFDEFESYTSVFEALNGK